MNYWVISDTHFDHDNILIIGSRPLNCDEMVLKNMERIRPNDVLIHLGDLCLGRDQIWSERMSTFGIKRWLVRGNHDNWSVGKYLKYGWDFVSDAIVLESFGYKILLSHKPIVGNWFDVNIHGHLHRGIHREAMLKDGKHFLFSLENLGYKPVSLEKILNQWQRTLKKV